ncbi:MAG: sulfatase-like hydrolase/transferase [Terriglobales bacterium]
MLRCLGSWFLLGILTLVVFPVDSLAAAKPNLVLITLDSTRADRMGFMGTHSGLTPNLRGIAHQGLVFAQAYAQAPATVASDATILTGTYPQTHRASEFAVPLATTLPYLPDLLHSSGYHTAAFVGSIMLDPRNGPFQGYDRGFDVYDAGFHQPHHGESRFQSVERHGDQVIARATNWLAANKQRPFFLWVHLQDPHAPYPTSYDRAVASADAAVGKLVSFLRSQSLYDDALIVIASSQGESLGAHGEETHGIFLYDETIHVPLVLKLPKNQMAGKQIRNRARLLDIAPTVLAVAGVPVPAQMQGQSLMRVAEASSQNDQPAYSRSELPQQGFGCSVIESWRAGKYLYIRAPRPELYDLSVDSNATRDLAQSSKATLETMASQLQALDNHIGNEPGKSAGSELTSSEMQKLASLGYVGLQKSGAGVNAATGGTDPKELIAAINKTLAAMLELDDGKPEKAVPLLRQMLAVQPAFYLAQYGMGFALVQQGQYAEAIGYLHKAIELQPDSAFAHYMMGLSLMKTGDFKTSAVHLEIASGRLPAFSAVHSLLAEVYEHLGRSQDGARERARAVQTKD